MTGVAMIGTGRMGAAMTRRLLAAGHDVTAFNRTRSRAEQTGATVAPSAREAAERASIIVVSLADDAAVREVYSGHFGLMAGLRAGAVVLETSTIHPDTVRSLAAGVGERSAALLDAPVSGSVPVVERGELTFMIGGDPKALETVRPVLETLSTKVFHLGSQGSGAVMKLAVNAVVHGLNQAVAESLVLIEKCGIERSLAYDVFASSAVASPFIQYKREAFLKPQEAPVAFSLDLVAKDLALIDSLARGAHARMDQLATNRRVVADALAAGFGRHDLSAIAEHLRAQSRLGA